MIVVETSTSNLRSQKSTTICSSTCSLSWPCATAMRASGTSSESCAATRLIDDTRLCTKNTWPSRSISRRIAAATCCSEYGPTNVRIGCRSSGGVASVDISRMPVTAISSVRGMGVALIARMSTLVFSFFSAVLVLDAEPLLLVDDEQADVLELHLLGEDAVRADDHVDGAVGEARDRLARLLVGLEPAERAHVHGESREPLAEGLEVLPHEQGRRHEHRDLLAVLDGLECGAHRDLGLAEADVAREQAVHRDRPLHVGLDLVDRLQLVGRLGERERLLELVLPRGVGAERVALRRHAGGVELHELDGDLAHGLAGAALRLRPVAAAHLRQRGRLAADVAAEQVELVGRHEELVAGLAALRGRVLEHEVLAHGGGRLLDARRAARPGGTAAGGDLALHHLDEAADAVRLVHDVVAGLQLQRVDHVASTAWRASCSGVRRTRRRDRRTRPRRSARAWPRAPRSRGRRRPARGRRRRARARRAPARRCGRPGPPRRARRGRARRARARRMPRRGSIRRAAGRRRGRRRRRRCPRSSASHSPRPGRTRMPTPAAASAAAAGDDAATTSAASPRSKLENVHHARRGSGSPGALNSAAWRNSRTVRKSPAARLVLSQSKGRSAPPRRPSPRSTRHRGTRGSSRRGSRRGR